MPEVVALSDILPQAEPMILLSGYEVPEVEDSVEAYVDVSEKSPFFEAGADGVPGCVALEYMAQTMALRVGLTRRRNGLAPKLGFVLGSRCLDVRISHFRRGVRYRVFACCTYQDEEFGSFDCRIEDCFGEIVAKATVTAFQPSGEVTVETLKGLS